MCPCTYGLAVNVEWCGVSRTNALLCFARVHVDVVGLHVVNGDLLVATAMPRCASNNAEEQTKWKKKGGRRSAVAAAFDDIGGYIRKQGKMQQ